MLKDHKIGASLKEKHFEYIIKERPKLDFFEIHSENYIDNFGPNFDYLKQISKIYPISMHCVGLSLGSAEKLNKSHLLKIKKLANEINPILISDHLSWSTYKNYYFNDLLPIPYNKESLNIISDKIKIIQDTLSKNILIENPSLYIDLKDSIYSETQFLNLLIEKSQCDILLDINNIYVSCMNLDNSIENYLQNINKNKIKEIHLAGHSRNSENNILIDTHNSQPNDQVIKITKEFIKKHKLKTNLLLEWDNNIPGAEILYQNALNIEKEIYYDQ